MSDAKKYFFNSKYCRQGYFTKKLDKSSSILLYFLTTFNANLNNIGKINPRTGQAVTLDDFFKVINLDDPDLCHKVWKTFHDDRTNDFLGDTVYNIADKYDMYVFGKADTGYLKALTKKC